MASRHAAVQQPNNRVPGAIKQKNVGEERKNRRALGDIGNVNTVRGDDGKPLPQVSRPVTRGFCARLLANAQAAAVQQVVNPNGVAVVAQKPVQKKAVKPKPKEIIEISPCSIEVAENEMPVKDEKSSKKKAPTLSSTLTARSMAACGLGHKPKVQIVDIDAADVNNDLAVVEYIEDMYKFYKSVENEGQVQDYMDSQPEINEKMRAILVDWLVQVHDKLDLAAETLYLTINIVDRYLEKKFTSRRELQLVGLGAMLIASKYEEIWAPEVEELVSICDRAYCNQQILAMEKQILGKLEWMLTVPTPYVFLVRFIKASQTESDVENMTYFLGELGMMNYETIVYCPSKIAASAVYAARSTLNKKPIWNDTLKLHTGYAESELVDCGKLLVRFHAVAGDHKLRGIYRKYSSSERRAVALLPPAESLLLGNN